MAYERKQESSNFINKLFLNDDCILDDAFEAFGGRWTAQVLVCIDLGSNRFGLLKQRLPGISDHMLGLRLNHLIEKKLIVKKIADGEKYYELEDDGRGLVKILESLALWQSQRFGQELVPNNCLTKQGFQ